VSQEEWLVTLSNLQNQEELGEIKSWLEQGDLDQLLFVSELIEGFPHQYDTVQGVP